jgi:hypothetical protein
MEFAAWNWNEISEVECWQMSTERIEKIPHRRLSQKRIGAREAEESHYYKSLPRNGWLRHIGLEKA